MHRSFVVALLLAVANCAQSNANGAPDSGTADGGDAGMVDAGDDGGVDAGDAGVDSGVDAGPDGGPVPFTAGVSIAGDLEGLGISDPSVIYPLLADAGFLTYSAVDPDQAHVHTRIATSTDEGATWSFIAEVNQPQDGGIDTNDLTVCGATTCEGTFLHEVPSLVIDPDDDPSRLFKVFTHTYFTDGGLGLQYAIGVLSLYTAPAAAGPWTETPLLGWNGSSPYSSQAALNVSTTPALSGLSHCLALTEPGALLWDTGAGDALDLAVGCIFVEGGQPQIEIDLIRSMDHGQSFAFVSTLLSGTDALALGGSQPTINAADLFQVAGQTYLFATPSGPAMFPGGGIGSGYRGCFAVPVASLDAGVVARVGGAPMVVSSYTGGALQFVGACTAAEGASSLGVAGDVLLDSPPFFGIFATRTAAP